MEEQLIKALESQSESASFLSTVKMDIWPEVCQQRHPMPYRWAGRHEHEHTSYNAPLQRLQWLSCSLSLLILSLCCYHMDRAVEAKCRTAKERFRYDMKFAALFFFFQRTDWMAAYKTTLQCYGIHCKAFFCTRDFSFLVLEWCFLIAVWLDCVKWWRLIVSKGWFCFFFLKKKPSCNSHWLGAKI